LFAAIVSIIAIDEVYDKNVPDLKLKDLRYLVALGRTWHFGHATAACFVGRPIFCELLVTHHGLGRAA
jgi:hypothetical protein